MISYGRSKLECFWIFFRWKSVCYLKFRLCALKLSSTVDIWSAFFVQKKRGRKFRLNSSLLKKILVFFGLIIRRINYYRQRLHLSIFMVFYSYFDGKAKMIEFFRIKLLCKKLLIYSKQLLRLIYRIDIFCWIRLIWKHNGKADTDFFVEPFSFTKLFFVTRNLVPIVIWGNKVWFWGLKKDEKKQEHICSRNQGVTSRGRGSRLCIWMHL